MLEACHYRCNEICSGSSCLEIQESKSVKKCGKDVCFLCYSPSIFFLFYNRHSKAELLTVHNKYDLIQININNISIKLEVLCKGRKDSKPHVSLHVVMSIEIQ